jgi:hypothetical protein
MAWNEAMGTSSFSLKRLFHQGYAEYSAKADFCRISPMSPF